MAVYRNEGDTISGDAIRVECRDPGKWQLFQMSGKHKGSYCLAGKTRKLSFLNVIQMLKFPEKNDIHYRSSETSAATTNIL